MKLFVLYGQRKCQYPGQYAPEALACMDENAHSDNPDYLNDAKESNAATGEFDALAIVSFTYDAAELDRRLHPVTTSITSKMGAGE